MRHIWFVPIPSYKRSNFIKFIVRNTILDVGCTVYNFIPKFWWQILRLQHTSSHLLEASILPLSHIIMLRCVRNRVLYLDTCIFTILNEIRIYMHTTIIIYEDLNISSILVLNQGFKTMNRSKPSDLCLRK